MASAPLPIDFLFTDIKDVHFGNPGLLVIYVTVGLTLNLSVDTESARLQAFTCEVINPVYAPNPPFHFNGIISPYTDFNWNVDRSGYPWVGALSYTNGPFSRATAPSGGAASDTITPDMQKLNAWVGQFITTHGQLTINNDSGPTSTYLNTDGYIVINMGLLSKKLSCKITAPSQVFGINVAAASYKAGLKKTTLMSSGANADAVQLITSQNQQDYLGQFGGSGMTPILRPGHCDGFAQGVGSGGATSFTVTCDPKTYAVTVS